MPRLILQFEDRPLKECSLGLMATIGRLPDNTVVIDNPAISSHHACVFREGDHYVVEDLDSRNGTFVNGARVDPRRTLQNGDVVLVGKHTLVFDQTGGDPAVSEEPKPRLAKLGGTVFLDTDKHKALLAKLNDASRQAKRAAGIPGSVTMSADGTRKVGVLRVLAGHADLSEYQLEAHTSLIGKAATSLVRLKGWFKPDVAAAITRHGDDYLATPFRGHALLNGQPLRGQQGLKDGDVLWISGLTLEFRLTN